MELGLRLAKDCCKIRQESKLSYRQFADICGLGAKTIRDYEKNLISIPTKVLEKYAELKEENDRKLKVGKENE